MWRLAMASGGIQTSQVKTFKINGRATRNLSIDTTYLGIIVVHHTTTWNRVLVSVSLFHTGHVTEPKSSADIALRVSLRAHLYTPLFVSSHVLYCLVCTERDNKPNYIMLLHGMTSAFNYQIAVNVICFPFVSQIVWTKFSPTFL